MKYLERDTFNVNKTRKYPDQYVISANLLTGENVIHHKLEELGGAKEVIPEYETLPVYEVEFIPVERRLTERCSSL